MRGSASRAGFAVNSTQAEPGTRADRMSSHFLRRTYSVARKELVHLRRDPSTLLFALFIPVLELFMLGYAIDTNVRHMRTIILDQAGTQESRALIRAFETSEDFDVVEIAQRESDLTEAIVDGRARVAIMIPENYSRRLQAGETAQF